MLFKLADVVQWENISLKNLILRFDSSHQHFYYHIDTGPLELVNEASPFLEEGTHFGCSSCIINHGKIISLFRFFFVCVDEI